MLANTAKVRSHRLGVVQRVIDRPSCPKPFARLACEPPYLPAEVYCIEIGQIGDWQKCCRQPIVLMTTLAEIRILVQGLDKVTNGEVT